MKLDYTDKVVLITGASGGLGEEAAEQFGAAGAKLAVSDINGEALQQTVDTLRDRGYDVMSAACDVTDEEQVKSFIQKTLDTYGQLDVAVNNAGVELAHDKLADTDTGLFDATMAVNVRGVFLCMKHQIPVMENSGGAILNVSSVAGVGGAPNMSAYAASKHAVIGLTKSAAYEYGRKNIRINAICPFITHTDMLERVLDTVPDREEALQQLSKPSALKRVAQPGEVVQAMLWACAEQNSYMTGHELVIDGGMTAV